MSDAVQPAVRVEALDFSYPGAATLAARQLSFEVHPGEVFGLLGPSGAGKSTCQNILIGLLRGWSGRVDVMGRPLANWGADYSRAIGVSFEAPNHYLKLTARENLEYFRALYGCDHTEDPAEVMALVGLEEALDKRVSALSKGMKQRLSFARSLLHRPQLWFLDEPTSGLDPVNARRIRDIVRQRKAGGITTFLTTHNMSVADDLCDRVGFIVDGALVTVDCPAALKRRHGRRAVAVTWRPAGQPLAEPATIEFPLDGLGEDQGFLDLLRTADVEAVHSQETTLEQVFIEVTGRTLT